MLEFIMWYLAIGVIVTLVMCFDLIVWELRQPKPFYLGIIWATVSGIVLWLPDFVSGVYETLFGGKDDN